MAKNYPYRCQINYFGIATRNPSGSPTKWCPRSIAKLVNITPITMVSDTYYYTIRYKLSITMVSDTLVNKLSIVISTINHSYWIYKPTYNWGAPHCTCFNQLSDSDLRPAPNISASHRVITTRNVGSQRELIDLRAAQGGSTAQHGGQKWRT
jgi:hypothetical protein